MHRRCFHGLVHGFCDCKGRHLTKTLMLLAMICEGFGSILGQHDTVLERLYQWLSSTPPISVTTLCCGCNNRARLEVSGIALTWDWCCQRAMHLLGLVPEPAPDFMAMVFLWTPLLKDQPCKASNRCCRQAPRRSPSHRSAVSDWWCGWCFFFLS